MKTLYKVLSLKGFSLRCVLQTQNKKEALEALKEDPSYFLEIYEVIPDKDGFCSYNLKRIKR